MTTAGKNRIMIYGREDRRYLHHRIQDGRGRGVNDQRAGWRDPRAQVFPGADALWAVRAGRDVREPLAHRCVAKAEPSHTSAHSP
jgi:hypothetical protein